MAVLWAVFSTVTENSIVFIIINNNNPKSQIVTSSQSKSGSGVVDKFNN